MQNDGGSAVIPGRAANPESRDSGSGACAPSRNDSVSEWTDGKIPQPQIRKAAFFPDPEQRPVQRRPQQIVALADGDADALAEIAALDKGAARERAAFGRIGAVDPERQRDRVAEDEIDLASPQGKPQRIVIGI